MERLPRRTPAAQMDIVGLVFDALADAVSGLPIIGDIVGFVASLLGNSSASNARIARLETIVSKGSSGYDDFNRSDTGSALGRGPQMTADWVQGGNGEQLRITGRAARLVEGSLAPSQGRRWARYPQPASSSTMTADTICDDKNIDSAACTTLIVCANEAFTEGVYANVFGTGVYLGKFTRSGTTWSFTDFPGGSNAVYKIGTAERIELRASGSGLYQLVVENSVVVEAEDTVFPIDEAHRYCGFAIQMTIPFPFNYQYGWGLSAFSMKSEAGTFTAIESVETVANGAVTVANGAQAAADNAVGTAVTQATNAAVGAVGAAIAPIVQQVNAFANTITAPFAESWMTPVPGQQVSFPDALLNRTPKRAARLTAAIEPFIDRVIISTGDSDGGKDWYTSFATSYTPEKNVLVAAYIQSNYAVGRATISIKLGAVTSPCELYVVLMRMLPNGDAEVAWVSPNQTPTLSLGKVEWNVTAPNDIPFDELEYMIAGVHQIGTGNVRSIAAIEKDQYARSAESFPPQQAMNFTYSTAITSGSVIPNGSQSFGTAFLLWVGVGQRLLSGDPLPRQHTDNFNNTFIWTRIGSANAGITDGMFAYKSTNDLKSFYYYPQPLAYGDQRVEVFASGVNGVEQGAMCRGNAAGSSFFALVLTSSGAALRQWTSAGESTFSTLATWSGATDGTYWALEAIGDILTAYQEVDGAWLLRMQVTGVGLTAGRYTGLYCDRALFTNSGSWDNFTARDMVVLEEAA